MPAAPPDTVDGYLAGATGERIEDLRRLRALACLRLHDHEERIHWGMPAYLCAGRVSFGFAARRQYLALYFRVPTAMARHAARLQGVDHGKGCLRFRKTRRIDWTLIEALLDDTAAYAPAPV